ncbi:uncharacterized protein I303_102631 [Kwoniella dejecticola CBS 10117]|uniref:Uncharacterized protein n=1 Tax=Kwoniella dejecticola CBS 10117 TaxID=1296121 RepID=A0A1A6A9A1_9TREE|nr:uncharacterized protein I303_02645 [Kwoniella dejecticola CBS 10117]OBR86636.1 hypothetical protein I303_02645 [Kwoniella dejecticola CBS 10117]
MLSLIPRSRAVPTAFRASQAAFASTSASAEASSSTATTHTTPRRRRINAGAPLSGVDLVAPPDPASNIRPIIYASKPSINPSTNSPYSASEFPTGSRDAKLENMELEWRLRRERVDLMNHRFWATTNLSFEAQKAHRLSLLPAASDPPTAEDERRKEDALTQFYADWQIANQEKQIRWVKEWWREVWDGIRIQGKIYVLRALRGRR